MGQPSVWLPDHEPRCRPGCTLRETCGRYLAPLPQSHAALADFHTQYAAMIGAGCSCPAYIAASQCRAPAAGAQPRVHPAADLPA